MLKVRPKSPNIFGLIDTNISVQVAAQLATIRHLLCTYETMSL